MGIQVTVLRPDSSVASLQDEIAAGLVDAAQKAAIAVYGKIDADSQVDVREYDEDFDNGLAVAKQVAADTTADVDLLVLIADGVSNDRPRAEQLLSDLAADGNFVVVVDVNQQPTEDLTNWLTYLDDKSPFADNVDVRTTAELSTPKAYEEVAGWAKKHGVNA